MNIPAIRDRWESPCGRVILLRGVSRNILPALHADAIVSDPPYGIQYSQRKSSRCTGLYHRMKARKIRNDHQPFDPSHFLLPCPLVFFGAEHFMHRLPRGHLTAWDKTGGGKGPKDNFVDAEFIWTNFRTPRNLVHHLWKGLCASKQGEDQRKFPRLHVSQKPVRVMEWLITQARLAPGSMIIDPFMGSGSTGIAALNLGNRFTGIEIERHIFKKARLRIEAHLAHLARLAAV